MSGIDRQTGTAAQPATADVSSPVRPNVVLIVADDMRADDLPAMRAAQALLVAEGLTFEQCFAPTPGCAPARASLLRGQYPHNHGVRRGTGRQGGYGRFLDMGNEESTLATWLQDAGYHTGLIGKYLNEYPLGADPNHVPPGWDEWAGATKGGYTGFELNENGRLVRYRKREGVYQTDALATKASDFITRAAQSTDPFFLYVAPRAPHGPATPAERHEGEFAGRAAPRPPSFNEGDVSGKPRWLQETSALDREREAEIDATYRARLETLLAMDELIATVVATLESTGALANTVIMLTSDHGYHLGEHRIFGGKGTPYEEAVRIPLVVRGPGVPAGRTTALASIIDLAPTIADWAGAKVPLFVDGRSLAPVMLDEAATWRRAVFVSHHHNRPERSDGPPAFQALRMDRQVYVEYADGWRELYDLEADPFQVDNVVQQTGPATLDAFAAGLANLATCAAGSCRDAEDRVLAPFQIVG
ncbi:MAG: sulfatase family protein [Thermomicrobiales bacterium]